MHILVLADNYKPEIVATSFRTSEHAKVWLEQGHEVTVVTCVPNWPQGKIFDGYRSRLYQVEWMDGVRVIRLWSYITANKGFLKRTLDFLSYMLAVVAFCWRYPKFDVILATSPQFFTAVAGWLLSCLRRRPWVFEVRDIWPESLRAVGAAPCPLIRWLEKLELFLYRRAARVVVLTYAFKQNLIDRGINAGKIDVVTNGVDLDQINPSKVTFDARERLGVPQQTILIGYIGTTGMAHGLETVLDAAELCQADDVCFLVMGQGAHREELEQQARERGLDNVVFRDSVPHEQVPSYYAALDMSLVHLRPDALFKAVIPSKIFECMAMGTPILMAVEGEAAALVETARCGICVPSGDAQAIANVVRRVRQQRHLLAEFGHHGQQAARSRFSRRVKAEAVLASLRQAIAITLPLPAATPGSAVPEQPNNAAAPARRAA